MSVDAIGALERGARKVPQRQTLALLVEALSLGAADRNRLETAAIRPPQPRRRGPRALRTHNLGSQPSALIGRSSDVAAIADLVERYRAVTIVGTGGVGKTRLALEIGTTVLDRYEGVWMIELSPLGTGASVAQEIASVLGIATRSDRPVRELIRTALAGKRVLLIVDNCEHVIDAAAGEIAALLAGCPQLTVLATSRESLRIDGEHVYPLLPLSVPEEDCGSVDAAREHGAVALFVERASARDPSFRLDEGNLAAIIEIARRLDGVPFAIELAAAKIAMMSARDLVRRLNERFRVLTDGSRNAVPRHRTLRALLDWSYALLAEPERTLLRRLSVFPATWTVDSCCAVCCFDAIPAEDVLTLLSSLVHKSLVFAERRDDEASFRLLESTRAYAYDRLVAAHEVEALAEAHARYVLEIARVAEGRSAEMPQGDWLDAMAREFENIRAAVHWCLDESHAIPIGAEIVSSLGFFWHSRRYREGARWLDLAVTHAGELDAALAGRVLVESVRTNPFTARTLESAERGVEMYRRAGDGSGLRLALEYLARTLINHGRSHDARAYVEEAIAIARDSNDRAALGRTLALAGFVSLYDGDYPGARSFFEEAHTIAASEHRDRDLALIARGCAELALAEEDADEALTRAFAALDLFDRLGDVRAGAWQRCQVAHALMLADRSREALWYAENALRTLREAQLPLTLVEALFVAAAILVRIGYLDAGAACLRHAQRRRIALAPFRVSPLIGRLIVDAEARIDTERVGGSGEVADDDAVIALLMRR